MRVKSPASGKGHSHGSILIVCLILISTLTVFGGVLISAVYERSIKVSLEIDRLQSLYLAEAALSKAIQEVKSAVDVDGDGLGTIPVTILGRGTYSAVNDPATLAITGIGNVNGLKRSIRMKYEGL
jgi:hypothetical protein